MCVCCFHPVGVIYKMYANSILCRAMRPMTSQYKCPVLSPIYRFFIGCLYTIMYLFNIYRYFIYSSSIVYFNGQCIGHCVLFSVTCGSASKRIKPHWGFTLNSTNRLIGFLTDSGVDRPRDNEKGLPN